MDLDYGFAQENLFYRRITQDWFRYLGFSRGEKRHIEIITIYQVTN